MPDTARFRCARLGPEHIDQIMRVELSSFSCPWSRESYAYELSENQLAHYYGCFAEGELVAFAGFWQVADEGHVTNMAVLPAWRRQRLGQLLLRQLIAACLSLGGRWMTLEVRESNNAAIALYEKLGFEPYGLRPGYYDAPSEGAVIMWLRLDNKVEPPANTNRKG